jgi:hypothetical protein
MRSLRPYRPAILATAALLVTGCAFAGQVLTYMMTEHPPYPLTALSVTSDARLDSAGHIRGTLVGSGTATEIHLLSSDTGFIAQLMRTYRPDLAAAGDRWAALARAGTVDLAGFGLRRPAGGTPTGEAIVASPSGYAGLAFDHVLLHGSSCGWRGAQAEIVGSRFTYNAAALHGPLVASFVPNAPHDRAPRYGPGISGPVMDSVVARAEWAMDSVLAGRLGPLDRPRRQHILFDPLEDIDAAEVVPFEASGGRVRYAVALRERRVTQRGDTVLAATVMVWDSTGTWEQFVLRPTATRFDRGRLRALDGALPPVFWRRVDAVTGFGTSADYLWMEQFDVTDGSVLWAAVDPRGNVPVAAAEVAGPCTEGW